MIQVVTPYSLEKNLGQAYNEAFQNCPDDQWLCVTDWDVMFLTPDAISILHGYARLYPETGIFTCWTNRIHPGTTNQLLGGIVNEDDSIRNHIKIAEQQRSTDLYKAIPIYKVISGFLMMINKKTWNEIKFSEDMKCLGVDNDYSKKVLDSGKSILCMSGLYVWHTYRLINGIKDKSHLL